MKRLLSVLVCLIPLLSGCLQTTYVSKLPTCEGSPVKSSSQNSLGWNNCFGSYTFIIPNKGSNKYVGDWGNGTFHGRGTLTEYWGTKYVGEFKYGKKHGQGILTHHTKSPELYLDARGLRPEDNIIRKWDGIWENDKFLGPK